MSEASFPYVGNDLGACKYSSASVIVKSTGYIAVPRTEADHLKYVNIAPLSVCLNMTPVQYYKTGVFKSTSTVTCSSSVNHAVTMVGYGTATDGTPYYLIKNSWGSTWGDRGYFRIARTYANGGLGECGILSYSVQPK